MPPMRPAAILRRYCSARIAALALLFALSGCTAESPADPDPSRVVVARHQFSAPTPADIAQNPALALVRAYDFASAAAFVDICHAHARADPEYARLVAQTGSSEAAETLLRRHVEGHAKGYHTLWEQHYAFAFGELLSREELESLARLGPESPHLARLHAIKVEAGQRSLSYFGNIHQSIAQGALQTALVGMPPPR